MDPPPAPRGASRAHRKKKSNRTNTLSLSLSPEFPQPSSRAIASPPRPSPALRSTPSLVSPDLHSRSASSTIAHRRNIYGTSLELRSPPIAASLPSVDHASLHSQQLPDARAESAETVRGPIILDRGSTPPLTPFPPWVSDENEEEEECEARGWEESVQRTASRADGKRRSYDAGRVPLTVVRVEGRLIVSSIIHGFVLALQSVVALAVFCALMWATVWKENESDNDFAELLWKFAEPSLVAVLLLCSATLLAHEIKLLSSVALLYLQSLILAATTAASFILWARCFQEESRAVKGVLMGCNVLMWGLSLFGFIRAVVVWKVEAGEEAGVDVERGVAYGTFVPWSGGERRESR
ncbi:hypothetical protein ACJ41O_009445 [Fusarium nematophilum]